MKSASDKPILLNRKVINQDMVETKIKIGKGIVNIRSSFTGNRKYLDILYDLACRKLSA